MCLTRADRARLLHLLLQFSKLSSRYPGSLILPRISRTDEHAVAAGHFGEIWKGRLGHHPVCLKVVKVYQRSDVDKLVNVSLINGRRSSVHGGSSGMYSLTPRYLLEKPLSGVS